MENQFIIGREEVAKKIQGLSTMGQGPQKIFFDPNSGAKWELKELKALHYAEIPPFLVTVPYPRVDTLLDMIFRLDQREAILISAIFLMDLERSDQVEYTGQFFKRVEKIDFRKLNFDQKKLLKEIILISDFQNPVNRRSVIGKNQEEVRGDAKFFRETAEEAERLLKKLSPNKLISAFLNFFGGKN